MADLIEVIPKTSLTFDGRANSTEAIVLRDQIDMIPYATASLEVLVAGKGSMLDSATARVDVRNESRSPEAPGVAFVAQTAIATVSFTGLTAVPSLLTSPLSAPIGPMVRVLLVWLQGTAEAGSGQEVTIAVRLIGRRGL